MGQRGKNDLLALNVSWAQAVEFIKQRVGIGNDLQFGR
jgi:hypothetical protein